MRNALELRSTDSRGGCPRTISFLTIRLESGLGLGVWGHVNYLRNFWGGLEGSSMTIGAIQRGIARWVDVSPQRGRGKLRALGV
jgi:hypothetical protein